MNEIIERKELELTKWNINNVKNLNLKEMPDNSKWNINKVNDIRGLFNNNSSLTQLPDI